MPFANRLLVVLILWLATAGHAQQPPLVVDNDQFHAEFQRGCLTVLRTAAGRELVCPPDKMCGVVIHRVTAQHQANAVSGDRQLRASGRAVGQRHYGAFSGLAGATAEATYRLDSTTRDVVISQTAKSPQPGVWGVGWQIADIPLDYSIIVPGRSGVELTRNTAGGRHQFDYPISWEAQLLIVAGPEGGFYVWAEDAFGRYKRLVVTRTAAGWQLELITINNAPFDRQVQCKSVPWHLQVYDGDWRVPARRYRDWAARHFHPTPIGAQRPDWVRDIRAAVIMGLDQKQLELLAKRLDPAQTLLYIPGWRSAGYDRDYPVYDQPVAQLQPFVERAHELGFRVMLHVNYFGVDPLNPAYQRFGPYQCRDPWRDHQRLWWLWTRADPDIRFAYINPALKQWRDLFVHAMVDLTRQCNIDALHLDQTLAIYNDHNGLVDGMTMIQGNIALHRQLRKALPDVALSGEGLNEITYRDEAFAQRHVWGVNHADGTWDRSRIDMAHPICSFLFRPYVVMYGYLGCAPPTDGQLYAAWQLAYDRWGVIPTLKPSLAELQEPTEFTRQFFAEVACWQHARLSPDMDDAWPARVAFPLRTGDGQRAEYLRDGRLVCDGRVIRSTIRDRNRLVATGSIPGWRGYDESTLFGLDPDRCYPYFGQPRRPDQFHVSAMPPAFVLAAASAQPEFATVRIESRQDVVADLVARLDTATCGSRPLGGAEATAVGPIVMPDGAQFQRVSDQLLAAHPPWKVPRHDQQTGDTKNDGTGQAFARYQVQLPRRGRIRFRSEVALDVGAVDKPRSDGVTFICRIRAGDQTAAKSVHNATATPVPLEIELAQFAGKTVEIELAVDPGPAHVAQFDWARWRQPRVVCTVGHPGTVAVCGGAKWKVAIGPSGPVALETNAKDQSVRTELPGSLFFMKRTPPTIELPVDLAGQPRYVMRTPSSSVDPVRSPFLRVHPTTSRVGGVARVGLFAHPPNGGATMIHVPLTLPRVPARLQTWIGIRDGSSSTGVVFRVEVNGQTEALRRMLPGKWDRLEVDLTRWRGSTIVLTLITDADGSYDCDWAHWGTPTITTIE